MMRSMYSGVAGLKTHQTKMDVIGNNIANVNTVAYKSQSVTFSELMYQTTQNASGANAVTGTAGINARQIGLGVKMGAINTAITTEGASQTTNNPFDIRITGDSFFVVSNATETFFTRDGSFYVDGAGNLAMTSNGYNVMGWQVDPETMDIKKDTVSALRVMSPENMTYPPEATTKAYVAGILDKHDTDVTGPSGKVMNLQFYDNLGYSYTAKMIIKATGVDGQYTVELDIILDSENNVIKDLEAAKFGAGQYVDTVDFTKSLAAGYYWTSDGKLMKTGSATPVLEVGQGDIDTDTLAEAYGITGEEEKKEFLSWTMQYEYSADGKTGTALIKLEDLVKNATNQKTITLTDADGKTSQETITITSIDILNSETTDGAADVLSVVGYEMEGVAKLTFDTQNGKFIGIGELGDSTVDLQLEDVDPDRHFSNITIDFSNTTMFNNSAVSTITATNGDTKGLGTGRKLGQMSGISISNDGKIYASYDNGMSRLLGQIAVATFSNASGLEKDGDNLYKATQNSGEFDGIGVDITADGGYRNDYHAAWFPGKQPYYYGF